MQHVRQSRAARTLRFAAAQGRHVYRRECLPRPRAKWQPDPESTEDTVESLENLVRGGAKVKRQERKKARLEQSERPFSLDTPAIKEPTESEMTEGQFLSALFFLFVILILEGLIVGASGFLPEAADQFVQDYIYKAFTPTVGVFLACSTAYGIWKTRNDPNSLKK